MRRNGSQFGLSDQQWEAAKQQLRAAILNAARDRRMTWYGEIAGQVSAVHLDPDSALMNHVLGGVFEDEYDAGGPALTSIVAPQYGDKEPAPGFYHDARTLGYRFTDPFEFWTEQVEKVFKEHGHRG